MASKRVSLMTGVSVSVLRQGFGVMSSGFLDPKLSLSTAYRLETDGQSGRTIHTFENITSVGRRVSTSSVKFSLLSYVQLKVVVL